MVTTKTKKLGNQGCFGLWNHCSMKLFCCHHCCESYAKSSCLCVTIWYIFAKKLCKHAFIYLQISDHFSSYSPNYAVPQDWWLDKSLNTTINACFVWFCHHQLEADDSRSYLFLAFSAINVIFFQIHSYNSQRKAKVRRTGTKSPTKANTDHHNGDLKWNK